MLSLKTKYMGLELKNPIIIGSSSLTNSVEKIKNLASNNAGAVVLKSLFEEQISREMTLNENEDFHDYPEAHDYAAFYTKEKNVGDYLSLIEEAKKVVDIPIIASINCINDTEWMSFAKKIENAGADAIELNIAILPSKNITSQDNEKLYFKITEKVKAQVKIPVSLKMSNYSAGLSNLIHRLSYTDNIDSFVFFNRYYMPDIDINSIKIISSTNILSTPSEIAESLRWIALLSGSVKKDIAASTGIHDGEAVIKQILAGAKAVQIVSTVYKNGPEYINKIINEIESWMKIKGFSNIDEFRGKLNYDQSKKPAIYERTQFMKYFGGK